MRNRMSDSDSSREGRSRHRTRGRSRSTSGSSSDSHYSYKRKSYKHKRSKGHRSRSRDRHGKLRSRHNIRSRSSSKGHSRRSSRDRSRSRRRSRSKSHSRRSRSRSSSHYRSRSKERYRHCSSSSPEIVAKQEQSSEEQLHAKLQRAIRAAQSADDQLRQQGLLSGIASRNDPIVYQSNIIDEINESSFIPKHFTSSKVTQELPVIDLTVDTPAVLQTAEEDPESIFHTSLNLDPQVKLEKWVKKLFHLRQKAINGEPLT